MVHLYIFSEYEANTTKEYKEYIRKTNETEKNYIKMEKALNTKK